MRIRSITLQLHFCSHRSIFLEQHTIYNQDLPLQIYIFARQYSQDQGQHMCTSQDQETDPSHPGCNASPGRLARPLAHQFPPGGRQDTALRGGSSLMPWAWHTRASPLGRRTSESSHQLIAHIFSCLRNRMLVGIWWDHIADLKCSRRDSSLQHLFHF